VIHRKRLGVPFRLAFRLHHRLRPAWCPAPGGAALHALAGRLPKEIQVGFILGGCCLVGLAALLGFQNKVIPFVTINSPEALGAVAVVLKYPSLEHIIIRGIVGTRSLGCRRAENPAKAVHKALRIGEFRSARVPPGGDESFDSIRVGHDRCKTGESSEVIK
jgi:hypothetical protein